MFTNQTHETHIAMLPSGAWRFQDTFYDVLYGGDGLSFAGSFITGGFNSQPLAGELPPGVVAVNPIGDPTGQFAPPGIPDYSQPPSDFSAPSYGEGFVPVGSKRGLPDWDIYNDTPLSLNQDWVGPGQPKIPRQEPNSGGIPNGPSVAAEESSAGAGKAAAGGLAALGIAARTRLTNAAGRIGRRIVADVADRIITNFMGNTWEAFLARQVVAIGYAGAMKIKHHLGMAGIVFTGATFIKDDQNWSERLFDAGLTGAAVALHEFTRPVRPGSFVKDMAKAYMGFSRVASEIKVIQAQALKKLGTGGVRLANAGLHAGVDKLAPISDVQLADAIAAYTEKLAGMEVLQSRLASATSTILMAGGARVTKMIGNMTSALVQVSLEYNVAAAKTARAFSTFAWNNREFIGDMAQAGAEAAGTATQSVYKNSKKAIAQYREGNFDMSEITDATRVFMQEKLIGQVQQLAYGTATAGDVHRATLLDGGDLATPAGETPWPSPNDKPDEGKFEGEDDASGYYNDQGEWIDEDPLGIEGEGVEKGPAEPDWGDNWEANGFEDQTSFPDSAPEGGMAAEGPIEGAASVEIAGAEGEIAAVAKGGIGDISNGIMAGMVVAHQAYTDLERRNFGSEGWVYAGTDVLTGTMGYALGSAAVRGAAYAAGADAGAAAGPAGVVAGVASAFALSLAPAISGAFTGENAVMRAAIAAADGAPSKILQLRLEYDLYRSRVATAASLAWQDQAGDLSHSSLSSVWGGNMEGAMLAHSHTTLANAPTAYELDSLPGANGIVPPPPEKAETVGDKILGGIVGVADVLMPFNKIFSQYMAEGAQPIIDAVKGYTPEQQQHAYEESVKMRYWQAAISHVRTEQDRNDQMRQVLQIRKFITAKAGLSAGLQFNVAKGNFEWGGPDAQARITRSYMATNGWTEPPESSTAYETLSTYKANFDQDPHWANGFNIDAPVKHDIADYGDVSEVETMLSGRFKTPEEQMRERDLFRYLHEDEVPPVTWKNQNETDTDPIMVKYRKCKAEERLRQVFGLAPIHPDDAEAQTPSEPSVADAEEAYARDHAKDNEPTVAPASSAASTKGMTTLPVNQFPSASRAHFTVMPVATSGTGPLF